MQGTQVYIYKDGAHYTLIDGYPKTLEEELGVNGTVNAAFVCPGQDVVYIIQGKFAFSDFSYNNNNKGTNTLGKKIQRFASSQVNNKYVQPSILTGNTILDVSLTATPRTAGSRNLPFALTGIDAAYCDMDGITLFIGSKYYHYKSDTVMVWSKITPDVKPITSEMMGCQD